MIAAVIPLYNKAKTIERAVRSVINQSTPVDELIVVDDGSTDGGGRVVRGLFEDWPRGRLVEQANAGVSTARNRGVAESQAGYICFLDADDYWLPQHTEAVAAMIEHCEDCGLYVSGNAKLLPGNTLPTDTSVCSIECKSPVQFYRDYSKAPGEVHTSACAVRRSAFTEVSGFRREGRRSQDVTLWLRLGASSPSCFHDGVTSVQMFDQHGLGGRAAEIPDYISYFARESASLDPTLRPFLRRIMRRGAVVSWMTSCYAGQNIARPMARQLRPYDHLMAMLFRVLSITPVRQMASTCSRSYLRRKFGE